eukprot:229490-Rhodomonas_salina.2
MRWFETRKPIKPPSWTTAPALRIKSFLGATMLRSKACKGSTSRKSRKTRLESSSAVSNNCRACAMSVSGFAQPALPQSQRASAYLNRFHFPLSYRSQHLQREECYAKHLAAACSSVRRGQHEGEDDRRGATRSLPSIDVKILSIGSGTSGRFAACWQHHILCQDRMSHSER